MHWGGRSGSLSCLLLWLPWSLWLLRGLCGSLFGLAFSLLLLCRLVFGLGISCAGSILLGLALTLSLALWLVSSSRLLFTLLVGWLNLLALFSGSLRLGLGWLFLLGARLPLCGLLLGCLRGGLLDAHKTVLELIKVGS